MNTFLTTKAQETFRAKIRDFAEKELRPIANQLDQEMRFPTEIFNQLAEMGVMGVPTPTEYGGAGLDYESFAIMIEELGRIDGGVAVTMAVQNLAQGPLLLFGNEAQKQKYLVPLAKGETIGAFVLTENNAGSDASKLESTAEFDGENYILNGTKIFITNAPHASTYIVFAVTNPDLGARGISAFIVEKGWAGFEIADPYDKMGIRSSHTCELNFTNVKIPKENLLGEEGQGFMIAMSGLDGGRIGIGAQSLGIAQGAYEEAVAYAKERVQFGQPIAYNQGISFKLADMATKLRCARLLVYSAAKLRDAGEPSGMESSMAKMYASDMGNEVVHEALQIFGGSGFIKGTHVERAYRDMRICKIYEGTNEIQRVVISSFIIGKPPKKKKAAETKKEAVGVTGVRKKMIFNEGSSKDKVDALVAALKVDGYDFTIGIDKNTPVPKAGRVVCVGKGIGSKDNLPIVEQLAHQVGAVLASSRPVAENMRLVPIDRYIGMSGQKFTESLYIGIGVSGAGQHLKGIKTASTIVAINTNANAPLFKNCDYGIVGDLKEIVPLLTAALEDGQPKRMVAQPKKIKRATPKKLPKTYQLHLCTGCGYAYDQELGDTETDTTPGTPFSTLPYEWSCPACGEDKNNFIAS